MPVSFKLAARGLRALPPALTFTQPDIGAAIASQNVQISATAPSTFRIVQTPAWIRISPSGTLNTTSTLSVSADPTGLAPGQYQDTILLRGPNDLSIPVTLTIPAPPPPSITPASITFTYQLGSPAPTAQTIRITNATGSVGFTAS